MKKSKKSKALLTSSVGLLAATSVVAPLATMTSCGNTQTQAEFAADKEYGITKATYDDLRSQFKTEYENRLLLDHPEGGTWIQERVNYLDNQLKSLDEMKDEKKNGFTSLTSAMVQFAKTGNDFDGKEYNIRLNRKSNAQWSQLDTIFASWKSSFSTYMSNSDMSPSTINRVMKDAENNFNNLKSELMNTCIDALDGVIQGKELLITCFDNVNDEIGLVSATLQLKQLMNQYVFETKTNDEAACLDNITDPNKTQYYREDFKVGSLLSEKTMNQLFTVTRKETNTPIDYTPTLIKGYTIQPKLTKISTDKYTNINTFSIDFGLVKTNYIGQYEKEKLASVTAHQYCADNWGDLSNADESMSLAQLIHKLKIESTEYPIHFTKKTEQQNLEDAYFNKKSEEGYISFQWDNKNADNQAYEAFFDNAINSGNGLWDAKLSQNSLMNSGIMICDNSSKNASYKLVKDIYKTFASYNASQKQIDELEKMFLYTCEISAVARIDETNEKNKIVNIVSLYANYNNSTYKYDKNNEGKYKLINDISYTKYQDKCVNHQVSKNFFEKINEKFNDVVDFVTEFDASIVNANKTKNEPITEEGLEELRKDTQLELIKSTVTLVAGIITVSVLVFQIWAPWNDGRTKLINVITLILLLATLIAQITMYVLWMVKYYNPMKTFLKDHKDFKNKSRTSYLVEYLTTSSKNNFVLINQDGSYDEKDFAAKKKAFSEHNMEWMLNEYRNFSGIRVNETLTTNYYWKNYQSLLKSHDLDPEQLKEKISGWNAGGKYWMIQTGITIVSAIYGIALKYWIKSTKQKQEEIRLYEEQKLREEEEAKNKLVKNIANTFKSIAGDVAKAAKKAQETSGILPGATFSNPIAFCIFIWQLVLMQYEEELWGDVSYDKKTKNERLKELQENMNIEMKKDHIGANGDWDYNWVKKMLSQFGWV